MQINQSKIIVKLITTDGASIEMEGVCNNVELPEGLPAKFNFEFIGYKYETEAQLKDTCYFIKKEFGK